MAPLTASQKLITNQATQSVQALRNRALELLKEVHDRRAQNKSQVVKLTKLTSTAEALRKSCLAHEAESREQAEKIKKLNEELAQARKAQKPVQSVQSVQSKPRFTEEEFKETWLQLSLTQKALAASEAREAKSNARARLLKVDNKILGNAVLKMQRTVERRDIKAGKLAKENLRMRRRVAFVEHVNDTSDDHMSETTE